MANEKIYPDGLVIFAPREGAPDFVKGSMVITPKRFLDWAKTMTDHFTEYQGDKQLRFDILDGNKGLYVTLNTYKPAEKTASVVEEVDSDLPF